MLTVDRGIPKRVHRHRDKLATMPVEMLLGITVGTPVVLCTAWCGFRRLRRRGSPSYNRRKGQRGSSGLSRFYSFDTNEVTQSLVFYTPPDQIDVDDCDPLSDIPDALEMQQVKELRQKVVSNEHVNGIPGGARWFEFAELLRYMRARNSVEESAKLFCDAMAWRCEHASLWKEDISSTGSFGAQHQAFLQKKGSEGADAPPMWWLFLEGKLPISLYGADRRGVPIAYNAIGHCDLQGCVREVGFDNLMRYAIMLNDYFLDAARAATLHLKSSNPQVECQSVVLDGVIILDLDGLSFRHIAEVKLFNKVGVIMKILHPERQRRCFLVRVPRIFSVIWKAVSPLVDARTHTKLTIIGAGESLQPLIDELGPENVPIFLGGKNEILPSPEPKLLPVGAFEVFSSARNI